jgi:hypothetical protein
MKIRTLLICSLAVLVILNVSPAEVVETPGQEPQKPAFQRTDSPDMSQPGSTFTAQAATAPTPGVPRPGRTIPTPVAPLHGVQTTTTPESPTVLKIFELKHADAEELVRLIENIFRIQVDIDYRLNRVIVNAAPEQMESIENLIEATDVAGPEASTSRDVQNFVYRIYMFEASSGNEAMKSFSMILRTTTHVSSQELLDAAADRDLQVSEFLQTNDFDNPEVEILIQGKAASNESLKRMVSGLAAKSHIIELKWDDDETFTNNIAAAQYTQLPEQMQKHIRKFLGDDIRTAGYWFGNSSVPGEIEAPIGPWRLNLRLDAESDGMLELNVEVEEPGEMHRFDRRLGRERSDEILSNTVRAKIGKPIIIGYNRESYGARKMGAMVIVPEVDMIQLEGS